MHYRQLAVLALSVCASGALAARAPAGTITYKPVKAATEGRPTVVKAALSTRGEDFVLKLDFDKVAYGAECGARCARATFLIDTDADGSTGLQQGTGKPPTGANLSVLVEGLEDFTGGKASPYVKVTLRQYGDEDRTLEDGDLVGTLDHRKDHQRVKLDGKTITVMVDASAESIPAAKTSRLVYLAPGVRPLVAQAAGLNRTQAKSSGGVAVERGRPSAKPSAANTRARARQQSSQGGGATHSGGVQIKSGGSAYDPNEKSPYGEGG